tara:strand:- start:392 stop:787 length:396 start_codon:yes stop_codon:yes gene_type:complete
MIPDKIYVVEGSGFTYFLDNDGLPEAIEYTRTPIAKKFADEKPKETGFYMVAINNVVSWLSARWDGKKFIDGFGLEVVMVSDWCEIILPSEVSDECTEAMSEAEDMCANCGGSGGVDEYQCKQCNGTGESQ